MGLEVLLMLTVRVRVSGEVGGAEPRRVLLVGGGDLAGEVCEALNAGGGEVTWLERRRRRVGARDARAKRPDLVCVATRDDAFPLRMALLVRQLDADVPLLVTIFDPGIAEQIARRRSRTAR